MRLPRRFYYACLVIAIVASTPPAGAQSPRPSPTVFTPSGPTGPRHFVLPEADASESLAAFSHQADTPLIYLVKTVRGIRTPRVEGRYQPAKALQLLLEGTPLIIVEDPVTHTLLIRRASAQPLDQKSPDRTPEPAPHPMKKSLTARLTATVAALTATAASAQTNPAPPASLDETILLSPFVVDASQDNGYRAGQTLSGTRLKTDLKDIGSSMTIFTEELMDDLGANNLNDLIAFAPNTDPHLITFSDSNVLGNEFINNGTQYVTRGGQTTVVGQDFFGNNIPNDRFNSEALTFTRGPNSILFGLGNANGAFVSSTKRAKNKTATTVEAQYDQRGSYRYTLDHNQVVIKDKLSVRIATLYSDQNSFRFPAESFQRRQFYTMTLKPFTKTTLRLNYETGLLRMAAIRPWPAQDAISPWLNAGSPIYPAFTGLASGKSGGLSNNIDQGLVTVEYSPAGTPIPTMSWLNTAVTALPRRENGYAVINVGRGSFMRNDLYPIFASGYGGSHQIFDYDITSVFWEQEITRGFFVEAAVNRTQDNGYAANTVQGDTLRYDVNAQLPDRTPNPNLGMLYMDSGATRIDRPSTALNKRVMASYEFDFKKFSSPWLRKLGEHRLAAFMEQADSESYSSNNALRNATPLPVGGVPTPLNSGVNNLVLRSYYDPANGKVGNRPFDYNKYPVIYSDDPLPAPAPNGITPAWVAVSGGSSAITEIETRALALQSNFWQRRLILTNGWRSDTVNAWKSVADNYTPLRDARLIYPDPSTIDTRKLIGDRGTEREGRTFTRGAVFHAFPWMSLTWNTSDNFQATPNLNVYGDPLPNPQAKGSDYGLKFSLFERKVFLELVYYTTATTNKLDGGAGAFATPINQIWENVAIFTGDTKYTSAPYSSSGIGWSDVASTTSNGYEFTLTANPTKQWRVTLNGSKRGHSTTTARGRYIIPYVEQYLPIIKSHPEWQTIRTTNGVTVATRVETIEDLYSEFLATRALPEDLYAPNWTLNMVQTYSFGPGRLKGFTVSGTFNARGKTIDGFADKPIVDPTAPITIDPENPFYAPGTFTFGAMINYQRKLFNNRIAWKLQLNVRNVFDQNIVAPLRAVDSRDGFHTPATAIFTLREPRTYQITSTFKF